MMLDSREMIERLYRLYFNKLFLYANATLRSPEQAKDIVQDTFHEAGRTVVVEFAGKQIMAKDVLKKAEEAYLAAHKGVGIKTLELYISPEQNAAYYVVNGEASKDFVIQL